MGLLDLIFGKKKPAWPVITNDMLQPVEDKISTADAKRIYKKFMLQIGYFEDREEADLHVEYLVDSINEHQESLQFVLDDEKRSADEYHQEERETLKELKAELKKCKDDTERSELEEEIAETERALAEVNEDMERAAADLAAFKKCKRAFLIDYINAELHGTGDA